MLSREVMGALALAIVWVNTLLVAAVATRRALALLRRRRELSAARRGQADGALAVLRVEQVGRLAGDDDAGRAVILFADGRHEGAALGGRVRTDDGVIELASGEVDVWLGPDEVARAAACPDGAAFDRALVEAKKARGHARTVEARVEDGVEVWVLAEGARLVSTFDPRAFCARAARLSLGFAFAVVVGAAICTAAALWPPRFGLVSTIGGALGLAFFLLVQPAGTAVRDAVRWPSQRAVRGRWVALGGASGTD